MKASFLTGLVICATLSSAANRAAGTSPASAAMAADKRACLDAAAKGQTLRDAHKLIDAREQFRVCARAKCPAAVQVDCAGWASEVEKTLPTIVFDVKTPDGGDVTAARVRMDGALLTMKLDGSAVTIDPGQHTFTFEVEGFPQAERPVLVHEGEKARRERVVLRGVSPAVVDAAPVQTPDSSSTGHTQRVAGAIVGSVGLGGLVLGGVFGGLALAAHSAVERECPNPANCLTSSPAYGDNRNVMTYSTASTVGFIAGGLLLAGGLTLYLVAPKGVAPHAEVQLAPGGVGLSGTF